jgi:hypothetical protein
MNDPVNMGDSSPWDMTAEKDRAAGYSQSLCVSCTNGAQNITIDDWVVTQTASPCASTLTVPSSDPGTLSLTYSSSAGNYKHNWYPEEYFSNTDSSNCPITSCTLYDSDCSTERTANVYIPGSESDWPIYAW